MNTHIKTWLGTLIIIIMAITAGMFVWKVYEINTAYAPAPQTFQIPKPKAKENNLGMANPASVFCEQNGGKLEIVTATDGSQSGMCKFSDGSRCEEWGFQRGECKIGDSQVDTSDWQIYKNEEYGFEFKYPKDFWEQVVDKNEKIFDLRLNASGGSFEIIRMPVLAENFSSKDNFIKWHSNNEWLGGNEIKYINQEVLNGYDIFRTYEMDGIQTASEYAYIFRQKQVIIFSNGFTDKKAGLERFNQILSTFKFTN